MIPAHIFRLIHTNGLLRQVTNKSLLAKLYKKGYTFANCKKALELHENDVEKAETWLKKEAQQYGRAQAAKLKDRKIFSGLVAVMVDGHYAVLAEVDCETDFVLGNTKFRYLAETVVSAVLNHAKSQETQNEVHRTLFHGDSLKDLLAVDGKPLSDHSALVIGNMGENIILNRALAISTESPDVKLFGCADYESMNSMPVAFGETGAVVAIKCKESDTMLGMQLCHHIIYEEPLEIGNPLEIRNPLMDELGDIKYEEHRMLYQKCFNSDLTVQQLLADADAEIVDFARFDICDELDEEYNVLHYSMY